MTGGGYNPRPFALGKVIMGLIIIALVTVGLEVVGREDEAANPAPPEQVTVDLSS